jgi:twitching motility protein PilT
MAKIDKLIDVLVEREFPMALIHPDSEIMVDTGGGNQRPLGSRVLTAKQIEEILGEVVTDDQRIALRREGRIEFSYETDSGTAAIMGFRRGGKLSIYVRIGAPNPPVEKPKTSKQSFERGASGKVQQAIGFDDDEELINEAELSEESEFTSPRVDHAAARSVPAGSSRPERSIPMSPPGTAAPIDKYLRIMFEEDCSDLHLTSGNPPLFRKDGDIVHLRDMKPIGATATERLILPIMPDRNYEEFVELRDTDFAYEIPGVGRFRVNVFMDRRGPGAVFRIIPDEIMTAEQLNLPKSLLELCHLNKGLVVVTGPTGSGKSTTLAAMIDYINRKRAAHIITVEDPIEFVHPNKMSLINQREVGVHTMGFKPALRAALREDPDIVLVGEMRDLETISIAIETAETGHLVFGTLHTNTAPSTVDRIIDQFPPDRQAQIRTMLSESLRAVIAQTLCKRKGGGRVAALETLMIDTAISNLIREGKTFQIPSMMETKKASGNVTLNQSLVELVQEGTVDATEAFTKAVDKDPLRRKLERMGHRIRV